LERVLKKLIISIVLLSFAAFLTACSSTQSKSSKRDAENLKILEQNVESTDSFFNEGKNFLEKNEFDNALNSFSKSKYSEALFYKALVLNQFGKTDEAKQIFEECVVKNVLKDESNYNLAMIAYDKSDVEAARKIMNEVVSSNPKHTGALFFLGNLKYLENDMNGALGYYEAALKTDPESTDLWEAVFSVRLQKEEFVKAWDIREKLDKNSPETVLNVLKIAEITGNYIKGVLFVPDDLKKDKNISRQIRILLTKGGNFKEAMENGQRELKEMSQGYLIIDRKAEGPGSYVIGLNKDAVFIVCSKKPEELMTVTISGSKVEIKSQSKNSESSAISSFAENFCLSR